MRSLSELLLKHPVPGLRQAERRKICAETISKLIGLPIKQNQIALDNEILSLSVSSVIKSEILLHETKLRELLSASGVIVKKVR